MVKRISLLQTMAFGFLMVMLASCHSSGKMTSSNKTITDWYKGQEWLNGLQLTPHASINQDELYRQYSLNSKWWNEAFAFIKTHDLANLKPGSYVIDSSNVIATVSEVAPKQRDDVNWEGHRNFNDLQYIITGKAQMGVASISDPATTMKTAYDPKADVEVFSVGNGKYYEAAPGTFFIFSPKDIHRPAFRMKGYETIKKVVIKVRVPKE